MLEPAISLPWSTVVTHAKLALATPAVTNAAAMNIAGQHQLDEPVDWPGIVPAEWPVFAPHTRPAPVTFFVAPEQGDLVARLGMTYAPSRSP
jgi:hypothetical protein